MVVGLFAALVGLVLVTGSLGHAAPPASAAAGHTIAALTSAAAHTTRTLDRAAPSRCDGHRLLARPGVVPVAAPALPARSSTYVIVATPPPIVHHHTSPGHVAESRAPPAAPTVS